MIPSAVWTNCITTLLVSLPAEVLDNWTAVIRATYVERVKYICLQYHKKYKKEGRTWEKKGKLNTVALATTTLTSAIYK